MLKTSGVKRTTVFFSANENNIGPVFKHISRSLCWRYSQETKSPLIDAMNIIPIDKIGNAEIKPDVLTRLR